MNRTVIVILGGVLLVAAGGFGQAPPKAGMPVLTTSAGQSPDVETLNIVMEEAGLAYDYCDAPTAELVATGVGLGGKVSGPGFHVEIGTDLAKFPKGTAYRTVIFAIGASLKGMGASGLTLESEEARLKKILETCRRNKILVIAVHVGGESKRGAPKSDNERMIDAVAPFADYLIVTKDSNKDGRFSAIAKAGNIPLSEVDYALGVVDLLKQAFD
jgi:hypothetical protein